MKNLPTIDVYCENTTGHNALRTEVGQVTVWYSYSTPVAFRAHYGEKPTVRENEWGRTTGKHLNAIDGGGDRAKSLRVDGVDFEILLQDALQG